ncbi:protein-tyrosine phosphatase [Branchiibius hedensis]|uniref:protein-tyrosine-phosphatase n=1 Tax=Branchiibius hedensis TaxID=672460 RepID=A0A2Y8ZXE1_9MICO|nr:low molecular weight phosphatase family protein [Branchiibius hedensis]PWJ26127.1 protein-tyrosine phosphatase [Branchiibius hedensis]SSA34939.1 protein-tyrosine phosphatase [Branchiibius hedensis]
MSGILVVCTGNVCRSPYVERLLAAALPGVSVSSAGTMALVGDDIEPRVKAQLLERGVNAMGFASRQLQPALAEGADLVITASREHQRKVLRMAPRAMRRTFTLRELADALAADAPVHADGSGLAGVVARAVALRGRGPSRSDDECTVPDPYGRPGEVVAAMSAYVDETLPPIIRAIEVAGTAPSTGQQ